MIKQEEMLVREEIKAEEDFCAAKAKVIEMRKVILRGLMRRKVWATWKIMTPRSGTQGIRGKGKGKDIKGKGKAKVVNSRGELDIVIEGLVKWALVRMNW